MALPTCSTKWGMQGQRQGQGGVLIRLLHPCCCPPCNPVCLLSVLLPHFQACGPYCTAAPLLALSWHMYNPGRPCYAWLYRVQLLFAVRSPSRPSSPNQPCQARPAVLGPVMPRSGLLCKALPGPPPTCTLSPARLSLAPTEQPWQVPQCLALSWPALLCSAPTALRLVTP